MRILAIETSGRDGSVAALESDGERGSGLRNSSGSGGRDRGPRAHCPSPGAAAGRAAARDRLGMRKQLSWCASPSDRVRSPACGSASRRPRRWRTPSGRRSSASTRWRCLPAKRRPRRRRCGRSWMRSGRSCLRRSLSTRRMTRRDARAVATRVDRNVEAGRSRHWPGAQSTGSRVAGRCGRRRGVLATDGGGGRASSAGSEYQAGRRDDLWKLLPQYYRLSAAERKRDKEIMSGA